MAFNKSFVSRGVIINADDKNEGSEGKAPAPIQDYDPRTLYERLQEQRTLKDEEFHEATRLSKLIKLVDADEAEFYKTLSDTQKNLDEKRRQKEKDALEVYRK
ncbi:N-terminal domain of NEFA-interacting nuclear protein NIP30-domain-containing protein [Spinellus fusiger]|nr:N-terminal domain of NEFA-interacting nuclear protein NIP30-domain-containing protein [Spinellus fusiger]